MFPDNADDGSPLTRANRACSAAAFLRDWSNSNTRTSGGVAMPRRVIRNFAGRGDCGRITPRTTELSPASRVRFK